MSLLASSESDGFGDLGVIYVTTFMNSFVLFEYKSILGLDKFRHNIITL